MHALFLISAVFVAGLTYNASAQTETAPTTASQNPSPGLTKTISLELNKLENASNACQAFFVVENKTPDQLAELQIDVFVFDNQGIILRRNALSFQDMRAGRTKVVIFDLADLACQDIGRFLINEVISCTDGDRRPISGCADLLSVSTRAKAKLAY